MIDVVHFFFFNDTATTEIYTLSLHDALPISSGGLPDTKACRNMSADAAVRLMMSMTPAASPRRSIDRKSTRLNSSHVSISYAVFCLKKKNRTEQPHPYAQIPASYYATRMCSH